MQVQERRHAGAQRFRDDDAGVVLEELVEHHAVVARDGPDLTRRRRQEAPEAGRAAQSVDHCLHESGRVPDRRVGARAGDELGDRELAGRVDHDVMGLQPRSHRHAHQALGQT